LNPRKQVQVRPPEPQASALLVLEQRRREPLQQGEREREQPLSPEPALEPKPESPPRQ